MIKRVMNLRKSFMILGTILTAAAFMLILRGYALLQEEVNFKKADGEIIVFFHNEISDDNLQAMVELNRASVQIEKHIGDYALISVDKAGVFRSVLNALNKEPLVQSAQANSKIKLLSTSNDSYSDSQWYIDNQGLYESYADSSEHKVKSRTGMDMEVSKAWDIMEKVGKSRNEVVIAVVDTGVDYTHPDLANSIWRNKGEIGGDNIDNDNNGYVDDVFGWDFYNNDNTICHYKYSSKVSNEVASPKDNDNHGTHIAGIIAAEANNYIGIAGIASNINIKIMPLKINGGADGSGEISDAIEAIKYATMMGADICNISWGTTIYSGALKEVMRESDMLFVAAAGNSGSNNDKKPIYPANMKLSNLISVTSINARGELATYSNYGAKTIDLGAPGNDIYSTVVGGYDSMSGSSMAAPQVSGVAALLYASADHIYASNVKSLIIDKMKYVPKLDKSMLHAGIPNAYQAVMASDMLLRDSGKPKMSFETVYEKGEMKVPINIEDNGSSKIRVIKWIYGRKTVNDFMRGVNGTLVKNRQVTFSKAGTYTFYASDYAGNEVVQSYEVKADTQAPILNASFTAGDMGTRTVTVRANDGQSGLRRIKYMPGIRDAEDFLPAGSGTILTLKNGKVSFRVKQDGIYTIFASDNRGNMTVKTIVVLMTKARLDLNIAINSDE